MPKNDRKLDTSDLSISGLLDATLYQPTGVMGGHGGKLPMKMKETAISEPAVRIAGGTPALHWLARKLRSAGVSPASWDLLFLRARDNEPCPESPGFVTRTDLDGALSFQKTQAPHRLPHRAAEQRRRGQTLVIRQKRPESRHVGLA
jgi:hypothetical protein